MIEQMVRKIRIHGPFAVVSDSVCVCVCVFCHRACFAFIEVVRLRLVFLVSRTECVCVCVCVCACVCINISIYMYICCYRPPTFGAPFRSRKAEGLNYLNLNFSELQ